MEEAFTSKQGLGFITVDNGNKIKETDLEFSNSRINNFIKVHSLNQSNMDMVCKDFQTEIFIKGNI